jgi:hypothetical protein
MIVEGFPRRKIQLVPFVLYFIGFQGVIMIMDAFTHLANVGFLLLFVLFIGFYFLIQDSFLSFEYKWMEGTLHLERVIGKGNHVYLVIEKEQIKTFESFDQKVTLKNNHWFCHKHEKEGLYLLTTTEGNRYVLKPSAALKEAICAQPFI